MFYGAEKQMERIDILAIRYGLQVRQMMELAGFHILEAFRALRIQKNKKIVVVVGKGNKGGDGLCAARHLVNRGWKVSVVLVSRKMSIDAQQHFKLLQKMKADIILFSRQKKSDADNWHS